jgi:hypothetical protein
VFVTTRGTKLGLIAAILCTSCTFLVAIPDSLTHPHGDPDAGSDAATTLVDAGDATAPDARPSCDALTSIHFCDDFDDSLSLTKWDRVSQNSGATATVDPTHFDSFPNSLLARIASGAGGCTYARPEKTLNGSFVGMRLAASVYVDGPESLVNDGVLTGLIDNDTGACQLIVNLEWSGIDFYTLQVVEQVVPHGGSAVSENHDTGIRIARGAWQHIELDVGYDTKMLRVKDAAGVEAYRSGLKASCTYAPAAATVAPGFHCSDQQAITREVRIDDVEFEVR